MHRNTVQGNNGISNKYIRMTGQFSEKNNKVGPVPYI